MFVMKQDFNVGQEGKLFEDFDAPGVITDLTSLICLVDGHSAVVHKLLVSISP